MAGGTHILRYVTVSRYLPLCLFLMLKTADFICYLETHIEKKTFLIAENLRLLSVYPVFVWHDNLFDTQDLYFKLPV